MSKTGDAIAAESVKYQGNPYRWSGKTPEGFDCSGFTAYVVKKATGITISPASSAQASVGKAVKRKDIQPGDILGWDTGGGPWSHVGIALSGQRMMNCLNENLDCQISDLTNDYWTNQVRFSGARRLGGDDKAVDPMPIDVLPAAFPITRDTPFRATGDVSWSVWDAEFTRLDSRMTAAERRACFDAAKGMSALILHLGESESTLARNVTAAHNWLGLRVPDSLTFQSFDSYADCVKELRRRWSDANYKRGVYMPREKSLADFYHRYSPPDENPTETLIETSIERINRWRKAGDVMPDKETLVFGRCRPPTYETMIVPKPWEGAGFTRVPPRNNVGMCMHKWWGFGDKAALYRLFGTGGEFQASALVDWSITQEGEVVMLNEPWKTRAGYANGPADGLEGDGTLFVRKLGIDAVNSRLVSCEFEGKDEPLTHAQMDQGSTLWAYYYDAWKVPYYDYPMHPLLGIVTDLDHWEIGGKECPFAGARGQRSQFQDLVRGKMRAGQTGGTDDPIPPIIPPEPDHEWLPANLTEAVVIDMFGTLTRHEVDGSTRDVPFDPKGTISNAWLARGAKLGMYPEASDWWRISDMANDTVRNIVSFEGGWTLIGNDNAREAWQWL